jgi:carbamoyl-phosphate synthase small subunit
VGEEHQQRQKYHPEATPGPHDSRYLFDNFIGMMKN